MKRLCIAMVAIAVSFAANGAEDPENYTIIGSKIFNAPSGVTNIYSGIISGTGYAIIEGGGTVAFSHPNNTYSGGTIVSNAVFRLDADGCAGTGGITGAVDTAHVFIDCANVPNDLIFNKGGWCTSVLAPGAYPAAQQYPLLPLRSGVTIEGKVSFGASTMLYDYTNPALMSPGPIVIYRKDVSTTKEGLHLVPNGRMIFEGRYVSVSKASTSLGYKSAAYGTMEFNVSSNELYRAALYNADLDFRAVDVFPDTLFYYKNGSRSYCKTYLNGKNQTIRGVCWGTPDPFETSSGKCVTSDAPASLRIVGCEMSRVPSDATLVNRLALFGNVTLVMDVDSAFTSEGFYQDFSVRKSTTTGDLIISNGDFRVSGTASFPNVPNIYVGEGGSFTNASTKAAAFVGCRNLTVLGKMACTGDTAPFGFRTMSVTLGEGAEFSLPIGAVITVVSLKIGDQYMPDGIYGDDGEALAQILQGTVIVKSGNFYVDCVNGDDEYDGSARRPYKTIRAATSAALSGDIIHVAPGLYGVAEGSQIATSKIEARVVVPENVTIESTDGASETFIVGAAATGDQVDNAEYGTGTNAIRCVYAHKGATLRGFTLTGGRVEGGNGTSDDHRGAAFFSEEERGATIENCIVSNNVAAFGAINKAIVRNCIVVNNVGLRSSYSGVAGASCSWYGSIIDGNVGNATAYDSYAFENCTVGANNIKLDGKISEVFYWWDVDRSIINSVILGGRLRIGSGYNIYCTNCLIAVSSSNLKKEFSYNTIFTNSAAAMVDESYRPVLGEFVGIDAGDVALSSNLIGDSDILGTPRILNGRLDIGAVEYDWRPSFADEIGKRFNLTYASPAVTTNVTGGLKLGDEATVQPVFIAGKVSSAGPYAFKFNLTGGNAAVYVAGVLVGESSGSGEQSIRFNVPDTAAEIRFVFIPDDENSGAVIISRFAGARGFSINIR